MSRIGDIIGKGLSNLSIEEGPQTLHTGGNRDGTGTWTALTGAVFHVQSAGGGYMSPMMAEGVEKSGRLICSESTSDFAVGTFLRVGGSGGDIWAIVTEPEGIGQKQYTVSREEIERYGRDKGRWS